MALLPLVCALDMPDACANDVSVRDGDAEFDAGMLKLRGIDPKLAEYFRLAPRFTAGRHAVSLRVNGRPMGRASARFDGQGALCVDRELADVANIVVSRALLLATGPSAASTCLALPSIVPRANVDLNPAESEVSLLVPTDVLREAGQDRSAYVQGGSAAVLNYEIIGMRSQWGSRTSRYGSANTEVGFNAGDWVVRSRQVVTASDGRYRTEVLDSYAQRSFAEHRAVLQLGQLNAMNPALAGAQVTGVQVMSEQALGAHGGGGAVEGVAQSQSRIEVRQDGVLVYSTVVPAGPFALTNIPRISRLANLDVTVTGVAGESQRFAVTPVMAGTVAPSAGYAVAVGRVRNTAGIDAPWLISAGWSGPVRRNLSLSSGVMLASTYRAIGLGLGSSLSTTTQLQFDVAGSRTLRDGATGAQAMLSVSQRLGERWSLSVSGTRQSRGFRELLDTARLSSSNALRARYRDQASASLSLSLPRFGNLSAGYSRAVLFDGRATRRALASWGARIGTASVSLSTEWNLGGPRRDGSNSIYLNASVPLGDNRRLGSTIRRYAGETRYGATFSEQVNEFASYRAGIEYRTGDHRRSLTIALSLLPRYLQWDAGYTRDARSSGYSLALRGGLVLHDRGLTASPYAVRDTFGVLSVGEVAGVRVSTPGGPVWTDARGYAVLPQLSPYGKSRIEVATDSLPRHVDIRNGASVIEAGRGAVTKVDFAIKETRRLLLRALNADGSVLPFGATVTDEEGEVVGLVQGDGEIFVPNALATPRLSVSGPGMSDCLLVLNVRDHAVEGAYYESTDAVCQASEVQAR